MNYETLSVSKLKHKKDFFHLPFGIYKDDPNWVAPIISEVKRVLNDRRNPYFKKAKLKLFVCYRGDSIVSRVAVIINYEHQKKYGTKVAFFGFFESFNDNEAVRSLFESVEKYCRDEKINILEGPFNPNHYSELGMQIDKFGSLPSFFQTYNPDYYPILLENYGFKISILLHTRKNENVREFIAQKYGNNLKVTSSKGYTIRSFSTKNKKRDLEYIREVNNNAFSSNWHFLLLTDEEYLFSAKYLRFVSDADHIKIVEYKGEPVGVLHLALDINPILKKMNGRISLFKLMKFLRERKKIEKIIIFTVGIKKTSRHRYAYKLLLYAACNLVSHYRVVETTWMYDENHASISASEHLDMKPDKTFAIYQKKIN